MKSPALTNIDTMMSVFFFDQLVKVRFATDETHRPNVFNHIKGLFRGLFKEIGNFVMLFYFWDLLTIQQYLGFTIQQLFMVKFGRAGLGHNQALWYSFASRSTHSTERGLGLCVRAH